MEDKEGQERKERGNPRMRPKEADVPVPASKTLALSSWEAIIEDEEIRSIIMCFLKFQVVILF